MGQTTSNRSEIVLTASSRGMFLGCPRAYYWRVLRELAPAREEESEPLRFGTLWHLARERWLRQELMLWPVALEHDQREMILRLKAMDLAYKVQFAYDLQAGWMPEVLFEVRLPGKYKLKLAGKIDALRPGAIMEHKTTTKLQEGYIDRLPVDGQILHYCLGQRLLGNPVQKVMYDIAVKPGAILRAGQTEEEFAIRYSDACAKNKSGKSTATRQLEETDEEYIGRIAGIFSFERIGLIVSDADVDRYASELGPLVESMRVAAKKGKEGHVRNSGHCTNWGRTCGYLPLCRVHDDDRLIECGAYVHKPAHSELLSEGE